jgi:hypothetical protein
LNFVVAHIEDEEVGGAAAVLEQYVQQTLLPQGLPIHIDFQVRASFKLSSSVVDPHWIQSGSRSQTIAYPVPYPSGSGSWSDFKVTKS